MRRLQWVFGGVAVVIVVLLVELVAQLVLPGIAADHVRDQVQRYGNVLDVEVHAFPALELLGHKADSVTVKMGNYRSSTNDLATMLRESNDTNQLTATAQTVTDGLLTVHDATLTKHGSELIATAQVDNKDLTHAIPLIKSVTPVASSGGTLTLKGTADLPIVGNITVPFVVQVRNGALIASPDIPIVGGLATIQVFSNPHIAIDHLSAKPTPGGFSVTAEGHLK